MDEAPDSVDRYFTEQVIGPTIVVDLGPAGSVHHQPSAGVIVDALYRRTQLVGIASRNLWSNEPWRHMGGTPVAMSSLQTARRWVIAAAVLGWSVLLVGLTYWWTR